MSRIESWKEDALPLVLEGGCVFKRRRLLDRDDEREGDVTLGVEGVEGVGNGGWDISESDERGVRERRSSIPVLTERDSSMRSSSTMDP